MPFEDPISGMNDLHDEMVENRRDAMYESRFAAISTMLSFVLVCRDWKTFVHPFLFEWMIVPTIRLREATDLFAGTDGAGLKGTWVRRLELGSVDYNASPEARDGLEHYNLDMAREVGLLEMCPRLEELVYKLIAPGAVQISPVLSAVARTCGAHLKRISIDRWRLPSLNDCLVLLTSCQHLQVVRLEGWFAMEDWPPDRAYDVTEEIALRSLTCRITYRDGFFNFLTPLSLPHLRRLSVKCFRQVPDSSQSEPVPRSLLHMIQVHGHKLLCLEIYDAYDGLRHGGRDFWYRGRGLVLLEYCPNLEELTFDLLSTKVRPLSQPHTALRRVNCCSIFAVDESDVHPEERWHARTVLWAIETLCGPAFPGVELIRCSDFELGRFGWKTDSFRELAANVSALGEQRNIRFEDFAGQLIGVDAAPTGC